LFYDPVVHWQLNSTHVFEFASAYGQCHSKKDAEAVGGMGTSLTNLTIDNGQQGNS